MNALRFISLMLIATLCGVMTAAWAQTATSGSPKQTANAASNAGWQNLSSQQKKALAPLAPHWAQLSPGQKNKWLVMSTNFDSLSNKEQATLHERMADWASLSPQQRAQARLTFNETKALGSDEKKTQWEAYQALSPEDKKKLAAKQLTGIQGAATASQASSPNKVIRLPSKSAPAEGVTNSTTSIVIDKKTLLPTTVTIPEGT